MYQTDFTHSFNHKGYFFILCSAYYIDLHGCSSSRSIVLYKQQQHLMRGQQPFTHISIERRWHGLWRMHGCEDPWLSHEDLSSHEKKKEGPLSLFGNTLNIIWFISNIIFCSYFWTSESSLLRRLFRPMHLCVFLLLLLKRKVFTLFLICAFPLELESKT